MSSAVVTRYDIRDAAGTLQAVHVRTDRPDRPKGFRWELPSGKSGLDGRAAASLPLYGSELLASASVDAPVILCEGEKAAVALRRLCRLSLATATGSGGTPDAEALELLRDRRVFLWPDNDDQGKAHMERISKALQPIAKEVRIITWPDAPAKGDAADFVAAGGTKDGLKALAEASTDVVERWDPPVPLRTVEVPQFPVQAFPTALRLYVEAEALATQTPADLAALVVLVHCNG